MSDLTIPREAREAWECHGQFVISRIGRMRRAGRAFMTWWLAVPGIGATIFYTFRNRRSTARLHGRCNADHLGDRGARRLCHRRHRARRL